MAGYNRRGIKIAQWYLASEKNTVYVYEPPEPGNEDLLDLTTIQALIKGGTVYAVTPEQVPDRAPVAALLRY